MSTVTSIPQAKYENWLQGNMSDMQDMWESMGRVERWEEGPAFNDFCQNQYHDGYGR